MLQASHQQPPTASRRRARRPKKVHYFNPEQLIDGVDRVTFLCGERGSLAYHGVGQHRPLPQIGRMVTIEGNGDCPVCVAVYDGRAECDLWDCQDEHRGGHKNALRLRGYAQLVQTHWKTGEAVFQ